MARREPQTNRISYDAPLSFGQTAIKINYYLLQLVRVHLLDGVPTIRIVLDGDSPARSLLTIRGQSQGNAVPDNWKYIDTTSTPDNRDTWNWYHVT